MLIMEPHWCYISCIGNLILSIKSVTPVEINVSIRVIVASLLVVVLMVFTSFRLKLQTDIFLSAIILGLHYIR